MVFLEGNAKGPFVGYYKGSLLRHMQTIMKGNIFAMAQVLWDAQVRAPLLSQFTNDELGRVSEGDDPLETLED